MSNNSRGEEQRVVSIGKQTYMFAISLGKTLTAYRSIAKSSIDFRLHGRRYCILCLATDDCVGLNSLSLQDGVQNGQFSKDDCAAISELLSASGKAFEIIREDASAVEMLAKLRADPPTRVPAGAYRVKGMDIAILVVPREAAFSTESAVCAGVERHYESIRVVQTGRYLAAKKPHLRLIAIEMSSDLVAEEICVLSKDSAAVLTLKTVSFKTLEDIYQHCSRNAPDILQMFYQCCKPARQVITRFLALERMAAAASDPQSGFYIEFDAVCQLSNGYFLSGWYLDPEERLLEATVFDHRLDRPNISDHWMFADEALEREGRREPAKRFRAFIPATLPGDAFSARICMNMRGGISLILGGFNYTNEYVKRRDTILATIADQSFYLELFERVYAPALLPLQQILNGRQAIRNCHAFGGSSRRVVTIIIPLYAQLGFVRPQLMAFVRDSFIRNDCQILYVLDDPALVHDALGLFRACQAWAPLDITLLILEQNGGFALANNKAFDFVEGQSAVLLNSDVIPTEPAWIETALEELERAPPFSIIGPKLLYADDSLQHAGMLFRRFSHGFWQNLHYWKGFGRAYHEASHRRTVPAVTGACMILRSSAYVAVGGFTSDYIMGDYEDSDLCMKLRQKGGVCIYVPDIELYHFERQSMPRIMDGHDRRSTIYNRALHTKRWDGAITTLMAEFT